MVTLDVITMVGMIGINVSIPVPMPFYSFGRWKDSVFPEQAQDPSHHRGHMRFPTAV